MEVKLEVTVKVLVVIIRKSIGYIDQGCEVHNVEIHAEEYQSLTNYFNKKHNLIETPWYKHSKYPDGLGIVVTLRKKITKVNRKITGEDNILLEVKHQIIMIK